MSDLSRRQMFMKIATLFNGVVGVVLAIPVVRYVLSPMTRGQNSGYERWISLGSIAEESPGSVR